MGTTSQTTTRLAAARRRASLAKRALAIGSAFAFAAALLLARESHPGQARTVSSDPGASQSSTTEESEDDGFTFGTPSVAPSTGTPQAQTHVS